MKVNKYFVTFLCYGFRFKTKLGVFTHILSLHWLRADITQYGDYVTDGTTETLFPERTGIFAFATTVQTGSGPYPVSCPWVQQILLPLVERPGHEADHSGTEVKTAWS
jgi:hypothetical protein